MHETKEEAEVLNKIIRGEISAVETYRQVMEKVSGDPESSLLQEIKLGHEQSADELKMHVAIEGEVPSVDSGVWGEFTKVFTGGAKLLGNKAALGALKQGEEHGMNLYEDALKDEYVDISLKQRIQQAFIPKLQKNIHALEDMMAMQS